MKKTMSRAGVVLSVAAILAACNGEEQQTGGAEGAIPIRVAIDTAAGGSFQIRAAHANGDFAERDLAVSISNFAYGIDTVNAMLTEQTDTGLAADYALLNALNKGDFVVVSSLTGSDETLNVLQYTEVLAVEDVKKPADIEGKRIGVAKGTVSEYQWSRYLEYVGIAEEDIKFVPFSTPDEAIVGVKKGDIDVVLGTGALVDKFKSIDGVHQIDTLDSVEDLQLGSYLVVDREYAEANPQAVSHLIEGIAEGITYVEENPDGVAEIAYNDLKIPKEDVLRDLERQNFVLGFTQQDYEHLEEMKDYLLARGILDEDYDLADKLYLTPAREVIPEKVTYTE